MRWTAEDFAEAIGVARREFAGAVRRFVVGRSDGGVWQMLGHLLFDVTKRETKEAENYPGIGIAARPPDGVGAEGVVVQVGGPNNPAIVAMRDEATRAQVAGAVQPDETMLYNSVAVVYVKDDGTIEARTTGGTAVSLCTKADADNIRNDLNLHEHIYDGGLAPGVYFTTGGPAVTAPVGTTKLKGE